MQFFEFVKHIFCRYVHHIALLLLHTVNDTTHIHMLFVYKQITQIRTFGGHVLPGSFLIYLGIWYTISTFHKYFDAMRRRTQFKSSLSYPFFFLQGKLRKILLEPRLRLIMVSSRIIAEVLDSVIQKKPFRINNQHHVTLYIFFGHSAIIDLLIFYGASLPSNIEYVSQIANFGVHAFLFRYHVHGRGDLDVTMHTLLIYTILINMTGIALEMKYRNNILCSLMKCFGFLFQGTWYWQLSFILYPQFAFQTPWNRKEHTGIMMSALLFTWHMAADCFVIFIIGGVMAIYHRRKYNRSTKKDEALLLGRLTDEN